MTYKRGKLNEKLNKYAEITDITPRDIRYVVDNARREDVIEVTASSGGLSYESMKHAIEISSSAYTVYINNSEFPVGIMGVAHIGEDTGSPWFIGTKGLEGNDLIIIKSSKRIIELLSRTYKRLFNLVHCNSTKSIRWITYCGFTIHDPVKAGVIDDLFFPFSMEIKENENV